MTPHPASARRRLPRALRLGPAVLLTGLLTGLPPSAGPADVPEGAAATIDGEVAVTLDEYRDHLLTLYGSGPLQDLLYQLLLDRELERLELAVDDAALAGEVDAAWRSFVDVRHQGSAEAAERELARSGYTPESYRANLALQARRERSEDAVILATRTVSEEALRARFEQRHGVGGVRVEVRHLLLNRARFEAELRRRGQDPRELGPEEVTRRLVAEAERLLAELRAGAEFEALARRHSHDLSVDQNGGRIPNYNYRRYGEPLAEAVRAAEVGVPVGPVETNAGVHLVQVEERVRTEFDAVREALTAELAAEPATYAERGELRTRLFAAAEIETF